MKKLLLLTILLGWSWATASAQQRTVERTFSIEADQKVDMDLKFGKNIVIKAWDKNEVSFKADIEINQGKLNDALEIDFDESGSKLRVTADYNKEKLKAGRATDCPDENHSTYSWNNDDEHYVVCSNIRYEVYVPRNADVNVESIAADIELVDVAGPVRAKSISGFVDLSWPSGKPADFDLKTISGEAFTDLDNLQFSNRKDHIPIVGYKINGKIGNGGPQVSLESISGNIYLRKAHS